MFEGTWTVETFDEFRAMRDERNQPACPGELERAVQAYRSYRRALGLSETESPTFDLYVFSEDESGLARLAEVCRTPSLGCVGEGFIASTPGALAHELVHFAHREVRSKWRMFNEGLATAFSCNPFMGHARPEPIELGMLDEALDSGTVAGTTVYYWAGRFVHSLHLRYGIELTLEFGQNIEEPAGLSEVSAAFSAVFPESIEEAWQAALGSEFSQGCMPVADCNLPLSAGHEACETFFSGGALEGGQAHLVEVEGDFGVYACDGRGPDSRVPWFSEERGWVYSSSEVALVRFTDLGEGHVELLDTEARPANDCVDMSLPVEIGVSSHIVIMPPFETMDLRLEISGATGTGAWNFDFGSPDSIGKLDDGSWDESAPLVFARYASCDDRDANLTAPNWPMGESGLFHVQRQASGPYIFEIEQILAPSTL